MAKDQTLTVGSPFKFGFYAGLGFFFASVLMSVVSFLCLAMLGLGFGTILAALAGTSHVNSETPQPASTHHQVINLRPAMAVPENP